MATNSPAGTVMMTTDKKQVTEHTLKHSWGARFRAAREAMNLSEKDAAARLHLKPHIINIIESERFSEGPPVIFMRGYIRSYGRMLNLSEKELNQALAQLDFGNPVTAPVTTHLRRTDNSNNNSSIWSTAIVMLVVTGLVGMWWWNSHVRNAPVVDLATVNVTEPAPTLMTAATQPPATSQQNPAATNTNPAAATTAPQMADATNPAAPPVAETTPAATADTTAAPTVAATAEPVDPTASQPVEPATPAPESESNVQAQNTPETPATAAPSQPPVVATNPPENTAPAATTAENNPDVNIANDVANEDDTTDVTPAPVKTHTKKTKMPNLADAEMSVPEEGLDNEPSE
jgi:cytoskeleton protein RodZ